MAHDIDYLGKCSLCTQKKCILLFLGKVFYICSFNSLVNYVTQAFYIIDSFSIIDHSVAEKKLLKSVTMVVDLLISPFSSINFASLFKIYCLVYTHLGSLCLSIFITMKYISLVIFFALISTVTDSNIAIPPSLKLMFAYQALSHLFTFNLIVVKLNCIYKILSQPYLDQCLTNWASEPSQMDIKLTITAQLYHILLIYLLANGYLCHFYFLAIIKNATINSCKYFLILTYIFSYLGEIFPREGLLGYVVVLCSIFCETATVFSEALCHFIFSSAMSASASFSVSSPTLAFTVCLFNYSYPRFIKKKSLDVITIQSGAKRYQRKGGNRVGSGSHLPCIARGLCCKARKAFSETCQNVKIQSTTLVLILAILFPIYVVFSKLFNFSVLLPLSRNRNHTSNSLIENELYNLC